MKNLKSNIIVKTAAVILSFFTVITAILSVAGIGAMVYFDFYTRSFDKMYTSSMESMLRSEVNNAFWHVEDKTAKYYYSDKNILLTVTAPDGEVLYNNFDGQAYSAHVSEIWTESRFFTAEGYELDSAYIYDYGNNDYGISDYYEKQLNSKGIPFDKKEIVEIKESYLVELYVPKKLEFTDRFYIMDRAITLGYSMRYAFIFIAPVSVILSVVILGYLFASAGYKSGSTTPQTNIIDRLPLDIYTAILGFIGAGMVLFLNELGDWRIIFICSCVFVTVAYFLALGYALSIATRIKTKTFIKNTIIYMILRVVWRLLKRLGRFLKYVFGNLTTVWKTVCVVVVVLFAEFILVLYNLYEQDNMIVLFFVNAALFAITAVMLSISFHRIKQGGERIASGDLETKIDTQYLYGDFKEFSESLNNINDGMQAVINEKMKSERLKTELITNVSHDIKTPLTSIINYVDLIKKENIENEKVVEYVSILDRQSTRLKKLIEDLVEASKASTGNLSVDLVPCELGVMLSQVAGEYTKRIESAGLTLVTETPETPVFISADGRRLWRVFDNLMNNVCKYAMPQTRVYISLEQTEDTAVIIFKNISKYPLNISGEELTERFVRGDRSRNTEGSGLGLSIAKSLTNLQGGNLSVIVDGDLFKIKLTFKKM